MQSRVWVGVEGGCINPRYRFLSILCHARLEMLSPMEKAFDDIAIFKTGSEEMDFLIRNRISNLISQNLDNFAASCTRESVARMRTLGEWETDLAN